MGEGDRMCGIAGFAGIGFGLDDSRAKLHAMCDAIEHRGPDSAGYFTADGVGLGMRRLSIIDVAGGRQPIFNEDKSIVVVFNGEIYNHHALRRELEALGHRFVTRSDTEVLVHSYEQYGEGMLVRLRGMFAFAIWDMNARSLFLARDRTGMKPLSYSVRAGGLVFCSELRSLFAYADHGLAVDPRSVAQYLAFGYVPDPDTIVSGVNKLPPGHFLHWRESDASLRIERYWQPPLARDSNLDERDLIEEIRSRLDHAVASHLESEVPLGAFLSGGLDSSAVVALMHRHAAGRVKTFSIGFAEAEYDESEAARSVAEHFGTDHTSLVINPDVEDMLESIATMFDEPFADSSAIPTFLVAALARSNVTVALSGDGGDELFGGYSRYAEVLGLPSLGGRAIGKVLSGVGRRLPHLVPGRNKLINLGRTRWGQYSSTVIQPVRPDEGGVAATGLLGGSIYLQDLLERFVPHGSTEDFAAAMMLVDLRTYLPGDILTKVDRVSMAVSLEARVPLLDFDLVDFALQIPGECRVTSHETKRLFRKAIATFVPRFVLDRPKRGFEVPLGRWFRGPMRHRIEALRSHSSELRPFVDDSVVKRMVLEHTVGRRDHSAALWRVMVLDSWLEALRAGKLSKPPSLPQISVA